jgi:hypothetical protein
MAGYRLRCDDVYLATKRGLLFLAVEMTLGAVALQASDRARVTSLRVEIGDLFDG